MIILLVLVFMVFMRGSWIFRVQKFIVNPRNLEHGFRMSSAGIPYVLP